jgi:TetR/AcrR family transcriptional regulator, transcriptional repressor for nem operon
VNKGERTRTQILEQSASLFNRYGYAATSLSDVMAATGLEKGGIYNHFSSKEDLMLEAFEFAVRGVETRYREGIASAGRVGAIERLNAILEVFEGMVTNPTLRGGCPMMNAAIEADDAMPALRDRVRRAMDGWQTTVKGIVERGKLEGQIRSDVSADDLSSVLFSMLEGAVMLSKLYRDAVHIGRAVAFLRSHLETLKPTAQSET